MTPAERELLDAALLLDGTERHPQGFEFVRLMEVESRFARACEAVRQERAPPLSVSAQLDAFAQSLEA